MIAPFLRWSIRRERRPDSEELRKLQNRKLCTIVKHSYDNVPYYNSLFKKVKLRPDDIKTVEDLEKLPLLTKKDLIEAPLEKRVAANIDLKKCRKTSTSGSTGTPLTVYTDKKKRIIHRKKKYRWRLECGEIITNRQVLIGSVETTRWVLRHPWEKIGIFNTKTISPFEEPNKQIEKIRKFAPHLATSYPSCFRVLAKRILEQDLQEINIPLIFTGGEILDENTRRLVSKAFKAEIFESYGSHEARCVCRECVAHNGCHINSDRVLVEIIRDGKRVSAGEEGEITVTVLDNYVMPFLRYNLGDIGLLMKEHCSCSNPFPLMRITGGRKSDVIQLPNGSMRSAIFVYTSLNMVQGIRQFQVTQERSDRFTVKIVKDSKFTSATYERVKQIMREKIGNVELDVVAVDKIPREKSGKFKPFKPMKT